MNNPGSTNVQLIVSAQVREARDYDRSFAYESRHTHKNNIKREQHVRAYKYDNAYCIRIYIIGTRTIDWNVSWLANTGGGGQTPGPLALTEH